MSFNLRASSNQSAHAPSLARTNQQAAQQAAQLERLTERLFETLIQGDRPGARRFVQAAIGAGYSAQHLLSDILWPTYQTLDRLARTDQITMMSHHLATRLLRVLVDQVSSRLEIGPANGRSILCCCGPTDADELGAQIAVDLLEASGFSVAFAGGGIANDEILARVNETSPSVLLMFASAPSDLPNIRALIDHVREVNAVPNLQVAVAAGVFNRAEGLAEEIGADISASSPLEIVETLIAEPTRRADLSIRAGNKQRKPTRSRGEGRSGEKLASQTDVKAA